MGDKVVSSRSHNYWAEELRQVANISSAIEETLCLLALKEATLEEKIIVRYLQALLHEYTALGGSLKSFAPYKTNLPSGKKFRQLRSLNSQVESTILGLLKTLHYNLSFFEQYFEHDFCAHLAQECQFIENLREIRYQLAFKDRCHDPELRRF